MGEKIPPKHPRQFTLVPVFIDSTHKQPAMPRLAWWTVFTRWFQYHSIQVRWYIERRVARLLHRRWGG